MVEITLAVGKRGLTQEEAGPRMGIPQPKVSALLRSDVHNLSERKPIHCLQRLGYDIEIKVKLAAEPIGQLTFAILLKRLGVTLSEQVSLFPCPSRLLPDCASRSVWLLAASAGGESIWCRFVGVCSGLMGFLLYTLKML